MYAAKRSEDQFGVRFSHEKRFELMISTLSALNFEVKAHDFGVLPAEEDDHVYV